MPAKLRRRSERSTSNGSEDTERSRDTAEEIISCINSHLTRVEDAHIDGREDGVQQMNLYGNMIERLDGLELFTQLTELCLSNNYIQKLSFHALEPLKQLRVLDLSANRLTSLRGLPILPRLQELSIAHNHIATLDGLCRPVKLPQLRYLDLRGNEITSITLLLPLQYTKRLSHLRLQDQDGMQRNPLCDHVEYPYALIEVLPTLLQLDGEEVEVLEEVGRVHMPNYQAIIKHFQQQKHQLLPRKLSPVASPLEQRANIMKCPDNRKLSDEDTSGRMRVFVEARERVGYVVDPKEGENKSQSPNAVAELAYSGHGQSNGILQTQQQSTPMKEKNPPIQRILIKEVATNTELDIEKQLLQREALILEKEKSIITREADLLQKETEGLHKLQVTNLELISLREESMEWKKRAELAETQLRELSVVQSAETQATNVRERKEKDHSEKLEAEVHTWQRKHMDQVAAHVEIQQQWKETETTLRDKLHALQQQIDTHATKETQFLETLHQKDKALEEMAAKLTTLDKQKHEQQTTFEATRSQLIHNYHILQGQYESQTKQLEKQRYEWEQSCQHLRQESLQKDEIIYTLKKQVHSIVSQMEDLKAEGVITRERHDRLQTQQEQLFQTQLQASIAHVEIEFRREHQQMAERLTNVQRKLVESIKQRDHLKSAYDASVKREKQYKHEIHRLQVTLEGDKFKIEQQHVIARDEANEEIKNLLEKNNVLEEELDNAKKISERAVALESKQIEMKELVSQLQTAVKVAEEELLVQSNTVNDLKAALKVKEVMLNDQMRQLDTYHHDKRMMEEIFQKEKKELRLQIQDLEAALDDHIQEITSIQDKYYTAKQRLDTHESQLQTVMSENEALQAEIDHKEDALDLIEQEMNKMRELLSNQSDLSEKKRQQDLNHHREELEQVRHAGKVACDSLREEMDQERQQHMEKYQILANDLKEMADQNIMLRSKLEEEQQKNKQNDHDMRVMLSQIDRERHVKKESLKHIKSLFEQLQQETP